ncbi:MAG: alkaline phosphatase D family protein [Myxococcota bacterium]
MAQRRTRRQFLQVTALGAAGLWLGCGRPAAVDGQDGGVDGGAPDAGSAADAGVDAGLEVDAGAPDAGAPDAGVFDQPESLSESLTDFPLGVSAGDVEATRAVVQTRYVGAGSLALRVWRVGLQGWERVADTPVQPADGGFIHLDVAGLEPGARYRYAFVELQAGVPVGRSAIGRFRAALPAGAVEPLVFGACSCTENNEVATPLLRAGERGDLDLFLLLGDTSYNDGCMTLDEYRARWASNLGTPEYRALRASTSVLATWDDHEVTNDFNPERLSATRLAIARQAFFEMLPLRRDALAPERIWKSIRWGATAEFFVLDGRSERKPSTLLPGGDHIYLSRQQMDWFKQALAASTATFKIILNSVPITDFGFSAFTTDTWRAYFKQRDEILSFIDASAISGVLWVAGDHHFASVGRISASGPGANALEVLAGPGAQNGNILFQALRPPRWDFASGTNNYLAVHLEPSTRQARLVFHDASDTVLFDRTYTL